MASFATTSDADGVPNTREADRGLFLGLLLVYVVVSIIAAIAEFFNEMSFDACGERGPASVCDYALADRLPLIEWGGIALITVALIVAGFVRARRGRRTWWLPLVAIAAVAVFTFAVMCVAWQMINYYPWQSDQWPR